MTVQFFLGSKMWICCDADVGVLDDGGGSPGCDIIHSSHSLSTFGCPKH
jgi:hypothetical protein